MTKTAAITTQQAASVKDAGLSKTQPCPQESYFKSMSSPVQILIYRLTPIGAVQIELLEYCKGEPCMSSCFCHQIRSPSFLLSGTQSALRRARDMSRFLAGVGLKQANPREFLKLTEVEGFSICPPMYVCQNSAEEGRVQVLKARNQSTPIYSDTSYRSTLRHFVILR
jgi:hypothetical protein